jgi:hypothetical protein
LNNPSPTRTQILATRAPLIRSFIRRFDTNAWRSLVSEMKVPNADRGLIAADKLTGYLLNVFP